MSFRERGNHGGRFGSFGIVDPDSGDVHRSVRVGGPRDDGDVFHVEPVRLPCRIEPGDTDQTHLYLPAPSLEVDEVDLEAGIFGALEDVPPD